MRLCVLLAVVFLWPSIAYPADKDIFIATPASGPIPLQVTFMTSHGGWALDAGVVLDFGDGSSSKVLCDNTKLDFFKCIHPAKIQHTYSKTGTFTAKLHTVQGMCLSPEACPPNIFGTAVITAR